MLLGYATQRFVIWRYGEAKYHKDIKQKFPMLSTVGVLGIVFVAMALKANTIISSPSMLLFLLIPLVILYGFNFLSSTLIGKLFFGRDDAIALVYGSVMRNLSIALAIAMTVFGKKGSDIALIIAMAYIIQVQSAAWYVRFTSRIFGKAPEDTAQDIMAQGLFSLPVAATLYDAIRLLDEEHIHSVAVISEDEKPIGIVTADIIISILAEGKEPAKITLGEIDLLPVVKVAQASPISDVIREMKRSHEYKVLVTDENGEVKRVLTESDILDSLYEQK